jgi:biotin transport system substrate-specific component
MGQSQSLNLRKIIFISLFTALIIIGGYISFPIPLSPLPIVLADFFIMLAGLTMGASAAAASVGLFLFLGGLGLPVFAGGEAGLAVFIGPKGGFLWGYLVCAWLIGLIAVKGKASHFKDLIALIAGNIFLYGIGASWLKMVLKVDWGKALFLGVYPFMIGMVIKIIAAIALAKALRPILKNESR